MRTCQNSQLWASSEGGRVKFPAFVHLPASALPHSRHSLCENDEDFVKCITIDAVYNSFLARGSRENFKQLLAQRWRISEDQIRAITVNIEAIRVLIENDQDWQEWVSTFFFRTHPTSSTTRESDRASFIEFRIEPIHIHIIVDDEMLFSATPAGASAGVGTANAPPTYSEVTTRDSASNAPPTAQDLISQLTRLNAHVRAYHQASRSADAAAPASEPTVQQQQQQQQQQHTTSQPRTQVPQPQLTHNTPSANPAAPPAQSSNPEPLTASTLATNIVGSVLQTLQPQLMQGLAPAITSILSNLPAHLANTSAQSRGATPATTASSSGVAESLPIPSAASTSATATSESSTQRQSLMQGMFDELSRLRNPQASTSASQQPQSATPHAADLGITSQETDEGMTNELGQAFAEMLAQRRATSTNANTAASTTTHVDESEDEESPTIVSTPSSTTPSRRSSGSRSRSRSRSRSPRRTTFLSTTTLTLLTLLSFFLALVTPTFATPFPSPSPSSSLSLTSLNPTLYTRDTVAPRQNSRHLHLCKCTCFQTNSTLVPLYSPLDPSKPCSTCTRQFCLDQGLEMCKGAKLEHTDHDVGTGFEGDVWAKCFERDSYKDQSIITLYLLVVVGLVGFAAMRGRVEGWIQRYQQMGPQGLYSAVRVAPWRRAR